MFPDLEYFPLIMLFFDYLELLATILFTDVSFWNKHLILVYIVRKGNTR